VTVPAMGISTMQEGSVHRMGGVEIGAMWRTPTLVKMPDHRSMDLRTVIPARLAGIRSQTLISTARRVSPNPSSPNFSIPNMRL